MEKIYTVKINGVSYNIVSDRSEEDIRKIEALVNDKITDIINGNPNVSITVAAVLTALNLAEDLIINKQSAKVETDSESDIASVKKKPKDTIKNETELYDQTRMF